MADFPFSLLQKKPCTPECDFSGEIVGGNLEGTEFKIGDCVFGTSGPEAVLVFIFSYFLSPYHPS